MRIGVGFPQTELGGDAGAVRAYAQRAGELGFTHLLAYDHVVGADSAVHTGWDDPYDVHTTFHEPMVRYGYLAAVTSMELITGVDHPAAAADRAGREAGSRGGPAHRREVPAGRGHRLEPR